MEVKIMKRIFSLAIASLFLVTLIAVPSPGQTVQQILEKMVEVQGGRKVIEGIKDMTLSGTIELPAQGLSGPITLYKKEPDKRRLEVELMGMVITQVYDGKNGWGTNLQTGGIEDMSGDELAEIKRESLPVVSILDPQKYGITYTYKAKEEIEGKEYYVLDQTYADGFTSTLYLDSKTYLTFKTIVKTTTPMGGELEMEQFQSDYKKVSGLMMAHSIVTYAGGEEIQKITVEEVSFNKGLADSLFKKD
jgi:outer membrane lipoprotein-sorting protein